MTYTVTPVASQFLYQFSLTNTGDTGAPLFDLFLSVPADIGNIDTSSVGAPVGWGDPTGGLLFFGPDVSPGTSFVEWSSDFSGVYDLSLGASLAGFSFISSGIIDQPILFALNGTSVFSTAQGPSTVPEPSTVLLIMFALAAVFWLRAWGRPMRE